MTQQSPAALLLAAALLAAPACAGDAAGTPAADARADAKAPRADGGGRCNAATYRPPACGAHPAGSYGATVGKVFGPAFDPPLKRCDLGRVSLRGLTCGARVVLLSVGAGWCKPCIEESKEMERALHARFCGRGLRIVQVLFQDDQGQIPTSVFCDGWRKRFGFTFPVLLDQLQQTKRFFDVKSGTPMNLVLDGRTFEVLFRVTGEAATAKLAREIEKALARAR